MNAKFILNLNFSIWRSGLEIHLKQDMEAPTLSVCFSVSPD